MNDEDKEILRANFKYLRTHGDFPTHQFIHGYISSLEVHTVITQEVYLKLSGRVDDLLNEEECLADELPFKE